MKSWPHFSAQCRKDVDRVLRSGLLTAYRANPQVGVGPTKDSEAWRLEREIEKKFKVRHAIAVNSGTAALHAALMALDLKGREVIVPPFTFSATVSAVLLAGGRPVFCDIDPHTFCLDPKEVKRVITKRTAAILPVHLFGYFPDLGPLQSLGLPIVEDACQAVGASRSECGGGRHSRFCGTVGVAGAYSFNGSKNLPSGEGGCLVTNDDEIAEKARRFINHGENFGSQEVGVNYRMHELVAVLARHGLRELESRNKRRRELVETLVDEMWHYPIRAQFGYAYEGEHVFYVEPILLAKGANRAKFISRCAKRGLTVGAGYITPILGDYPAFRRFKSAPLPVAEELSSKTLCILSNLTPDKPLSEARRTAKIIREALE